MVHFLKKKKLSFLIVQPDALSVYQDNVFLGRNDVTLSNIDIIYQINDRKKRLVAPNIKILSKLDVLHIVCKVILILNAIYFE